jgi:hypothetical protein
MKKKTTKKEPKKQVVEIHIYVHQNNWTVPPFNIPSPTNPQNPNYPFIPNYPITTC